MSFSDPTPSAHEAWRSPVVSELQDILPHHEVLDFIGRGGMGAVYKARQQTLNRVVAVKLLPRHSPVPGGLDFAARFTVEAQSMARLSHPNIVALHEFGHTEDGLLYYVMEFVDGTDLGKRLASEGRLPVGEALRIALAVCDALESAHAEGVVHRDVKPSNILLSHDGKVKVADFGLAKIDDPSTITLTLSGTSMGSQGYAAPEVFCKASTADHRADIFSLGVVLYEMLTGDVPRGMFKLPSEKVLALDTRFDELICKAMEEDREDRFQSVTEFKAALQSAMVQPVTPIVGDASRAPATSPPRARRIAWATFGVGAAIVALAGLVSERVTLTPPEETTPDQGTAAVAHSAAWASLLGSIDGRPVPSAQWGSIRTGDNNSASPPSKWLQELPVPFSESCDLRFRITKTEGDDGFVHFGFRHGDHGGSIVLLDRKHGFGKSFAGIAYLDGKGANQNSDWVQQRDFPLLPVGETRTILLQIRDEGVAVLLDDREIYRWTGDWKRLGQLPFLYPKDLEKPLFAVGGNQTKFTVHSSEVRRVTGEEGKRLPSALDRQPPALLGTVGPASAPAAPDPPTDAELRAFAAWLFSLPSSTEPGHVGPNKAPDLVIDGLNRNFRRVAELPARPFSVTRVRTGPLRLDDTSRQHLKVLGRIPRLWDLRIYGADDAAVLGFLRERTHLGTLILKAPQETRELKDIALVNLGRLTNLNALRLGNWRGFTGQGFVHLIEKRSLDALGLSGCPDIDDEGLQQIARFPNLKSLSLMLGAGVTDAGLAKLARLVKLENLSLYFTENTKVTGAGLETLGALKNLKALQLEGKFPGAAFAQVGKLASLEVLECLHNATVTDAVLPGLAGLKNLRSLRLTDTNLTGTGFAGFTSSSIKLQQLHVHGCKVTAEGLRAIVDAFPELDSIAVSRNTQRHAAEDLVRELSRAPALRKLQCGYGFKDEHMPELTKLSRLTALNLQFSHVTSAALPHLKSLPNLTELNLMGLRLDDACLPALREMRGLKALVLTDTQVSDAGAAEVKKALPECTIVR